MSRILSERLKKFLDEELATEYESPMACFLDAADACVGICEEGGDNKGPMVEAFQVTIGGACGESWCLSFVQALTAYVEERYNLVSNLPLTELCMNLWQNAPKDSKFVKEKEPQPGDLVVWQYGNTSKGHVGIVTANAFRAIFTVEGNSSDSKNIDREGQGVFKKIRTKTGTTTMRLVGYVRPSFT